MIQFADYIKTKEEIVVSDSGYSQLEIENLLQQIEINAQDALLSDAVSKKRQRICCRGHSVDSVSSSKF